MGYQHNSDSNYFISNCFASNCGSYAFNVQGWYDAENKLEDSVGDIETWIREMAADYTDDEITDIYTDVLIDQILYDFDGEIRMVESELSPVASNEELIAFRTYCLYDEEWDWVGWDFHFKVFRDGCWKEKCGTNPIRTCTLNEWVNGENVYTSKTHFFAHKTS